MMETAELLGLARQTIEKLGVRIEVRKLDDPEFSVNSGLCRIGKTRFLFLDRGLPPGAELNVYLDTLAALETEGIFVPPVLRDMIERKREATGP